MTDFVPRRIRGPCRAGSPRTDGPTGAKRRVAGYIVDGTTHRAWGPYGSGCKGDCTGTSLTVRYHIGVPSRAEGISGRVGRFTAAVCAVTEMGLRLRGY